MIERTRRQKSKLRLQHSKQDKMIKKTKPKTVKKKTDNKKKQNKGN